MSFRSNTKRGTIFLGFESLVMLLHDKFANFILQVTDLGMAKCLSNDGFPSCSSSPERIQGTFGYFAPEYAIVGKGSLKSDVFSFGVVLLELVTGRTPIFNVSDKGDESLVIWVCNLLLSHASMARFC